MTEASREDLVQADSGDAALTEKSPDYWSRVMGDARLARARKVLSIYELRLLLIHARNDWQPIQTAPHETRVILYSPDGTIEIGCASTGWRERINGYSNRSWHGSATHWMPLPEPPSNVDRSNEPESDPVSLNQTSLPPSEDSP